jgi:hypothetical protein
VPLACYRGAVLLGHVLAPLPIGIERIDGAPGEGAGVDYVIDQDRVVCRASEQETSRFRFTGEVPGSADEGVEAFGWDRDRPRRM